MDGEVLVGRRSESARFAALLTRLAPEEGARTGRRRPRRPSAEDPAAGTGSNVVVVYGLGGIGKSRLLRHFRDMAQGKAEATPLSPGMIKTVWLDWKDEQRDDPGSYARPGGPDLVTVLNSVQTAVIAAFSGDDRATHQASQAFGHYRQGAARIPEYASRFADVLVQNGRAGSPFTSQDVMTILKTAASAGLAAGGHPAGIAGLTPDQLAAAGEAGGHLSAAAMRAVTGKKPGEIPPEEYQLVTDPARELARRAAGALLAI